MRHDVHLHALRAAAHVALALPLLHACTRGPAPESRAPAEPQPVRPVAPVSTAEPIARAEDDTPTPATECSDVVDYAFPVPSDYPGEPRKVSPIVQACCVELLAAGAGGAEEHRWDCCANLPPSAHSTGQIGAACTPWGPAVPPAMPRVAARRHTPTPAPIILDLRARARAVPLVLPPCSDDGLRRSAIATWRGRMKNEHASARVFEAFATQLAGAGLGDLVDEVRGFAAEERRHGILCGAVVEALGGHACAPLDPPEPVPMHDDAHTPLEAALRNLIDICCLSETVAVALIGAERLQMPDGDLRRLLTRIWADEVGHARWGWRTLRRVAPRLDIATRERLGDYLQVAFGHLVEHELAHLPAGSRPPAEGAVFGVCDGADAQRLFFDTVRAVIVPALQVHAIPAARAWARAAA